MSQADKIIACLESIVPGRCCDACLSRKTGIKPPRQLGQLCRELAREGRIVRKRGKCPMGDHTKVLSALPTMAPRKATPAPDPDGLSIEDAWRYVDRFCRALWMTHLDDEPPSSLAEIINALRDDELLPLHQSNMMHTVRALRNQVVHENVDFGDHETTIARAAWNIIRDWAEREEQQAWTLVESVCAARAA